MKNTKKIINLVIAFAIVAGSMLVYSFSKPVQYLYHEGYTMKTESFRLPADGSDVSTLGDIDKSNALFAVEQTQYNLYIYDQSKFEMTHQNLGSPNVESLGEGQAMLIKSNESTVSGYAANGSMVTQFSQDANAVQEVNNLLQILTAEAQGGGFNLQQFLNDAKNNGLNVISQNSNVIVLSCSYPNGMSEEFAINAQTGVKVSSALTVNGQLFMEAAYNYDTSAKPKLVEESKVYYETSSASGIAMKKYVKTTFTDHVEENFIK
jgi:hypothetical protein